jgi:hypothetical protein
MVSYVKRPSNVAGKGQTWVLPSIASVLKQLEKKYYHFITKRYNFPQ